MRRSKKRVASLTIGDTVIVPISEFDRSKASLRSMLGVIVEGDREAMGYTVKTKLGILDTKYLNGTITKSTAQLNLSDNVSSKIVSVRAEQDLKAWKSVAVVKVIVNAIALGNIRETTVAAKRRIFYARLIAIQLVKNVKINRDITDFPIDNFFINYKIYY